MAALRRRIIGGMVTAGALLLLVALCYFKARRHAAKLPRSQFEQSSPIANPPDSSNLPVSMHSTGRQDDVRELDILEPNPSNITSERPTRPSLRLRLPFRSKLSSAVTPPVPMMSLAIPSPGSPITSAPPAAPTTPPAAASNPDSELQTEVAALRLQVEHLQAMVTNAPAAP